MFPQLPVHPSTECTGTDTLYSDPIWFFDGNCHKTQSQTNRHPSIDCHIRRGQPLSPSIRLLSTCDITLSLREASGLLLHILGGVCPLLRAEVQHQCLRRYIVSVGSERHQNWGEYVVGGWRRSILGYIMAGAFFDCWVVPAPDGTIYLVDINGTRYLGSI